MIDMELIFKVLPCIEEHKILFATDTVKGEALYWWNAQLGPNTTDYLVTISGITQEPILPIISF